MKKKLLTSLFVAFSVCMGVSTACLTAGASDAEITVDNANVTMVAGASARISDDGYNGLRYTMTTSATDYQGLKATYGANVSFGILIAPKAYDDANELNAANVFGEEAVYDWAEWDEATETYVYSGNKTRIINLSSATMKAAENDENTYVLYGAIANLKAENITKEFVGVGYIAYGDGETTNYKFLADNDNTRSMAYVAQVYQTLDGVAQETKDLVKENYITGKADQEDTFYTVNHMLSDGNGGYTVESEQVTAKINSETVTPTAKTFAGYTFEQTNANNATGGALVYANGKTAALNLYYTNDTTRNMKKNADGTYTAPKGWQSYGYQYTTVTPATTAFYSVKVTGNAAIVGSNGWSPCVGITVTNGEIIDNQDLTYEGYRYPAIVGDIRTHWENTYYGTCFGLTNDRNLKMFSGKSMAALNMSSFNTNLMLKDANLTRTLTLILKNDTFYFYIDHNLVQTIGVDNAGFKPTRATKSGKTYGYEKGDAFLFGISAHNEESQITFSDIVEYYGDEATQAIEANPYYSSSAKTLATGWHAFGSEYTTTTAASAAIYEVNIIATADLLGSNDWMGNVGIAISNGTAHGADKWQPVEIGNAKTGGTRGSGQTNAKATSIFGISTYGGLNQPLQRYVALSSGIMSKITGWTKDGETIVSQHKGKVGSIAAIGTMLDSPIKTLNLKVVFYNGTLSFYMNNVYLMTVSLDDAMFDYTNTESVDISMSSTDKLYFGLAAVNLSANAVKAVVTTELYDNAAITEITTNEAYADVINAQA